jgi:hypothetical protein
MTVAAQWYVAAVAATCGIAMVAMWATSLLRDQVPEVHAGRAIWFHVTAELATAAALVACAVGLVASDASFPWRAACAAALGALLYTVTQSPGYFVDRREWPMVAVFALLALLTLPALALVVGS